MPDQTAKALRELAEKVAADRTIYIPCYDLREDRAACPNRHGDWNLKELILTIAHYADC